MLCTCLQASRATPKARPVLALNSFAASTTSGFDRNPQEAMAGKRKGEGKETASTKKSKKAEEAAEQPEEKASDKKQGKSKKSSEGSKAASTKGAHSLKPRPKTSDDSPRVPPKPFTKAGTKLVATSVDLSEGNRDKQGFLTFEGFPEFKPNMTPKQVIQAGSFGGIYFNPHGGKPSTKWPKGVPVDHTEFPEDWFEGLHPDYFIARRYIAKRNKYQVKAGQEQAAWEEHGWIIDQDPRGWFHWYCRFYQGRRTDDDDRQIGRWKGVCGLKGRWKRSLVNKILDKGTEWNDAGVSPVIRQSLLHWAYELTEPHYKKMAKEVQKE